MGPGEAVLDEERGEVEYGDHEFLLVEARSVALANPSNVRRGSGRFRHERTRLTRDKR